MPFFLLINIEMPTIVGILTFMSRKNSCSAECSTKKSFITLGPYFLRKLVIYVINIGRRPGVNISFPEHNSATVRNSLTVLSRFIEQVNAKRRMQELRLCLSSFPNYLP